MRLSFFLRLSLRLCALLIVERSSKSLSTLSLSFMCLFVSLLVFLFRQTNFCSFSVWCLRVTVNRFLIPPFSGDLSVRLSVFIYFPHSQVSFFFFHSSSTHLSVRLSLYFSSFSIGLSFTKLAFTYSSHIQLYLFLILPLSCYLFVIFFFSCFPLLSNCHCIPRPSLSVSRLTN